MQTETQIKEAFKNIKELKEAKKIFKTLAKKLHPDTGGTNEEFKTLNKVYNDFLNNDLYFDSETKINIDLEKIISQILHFENLEIEIVGCWIWISGDTRAVKETLKNLGFKWASKKKMWYYGELKKVSSRGKKDINEIRATYGSQKVATKQNIRIAA